MSSRIDAVTEAVRDHIASFDPQTRAELDGFFKGLPDMFSELGQALAHAGENLTNEHVHHDVVDALRELGGVVAGISQHAEDVYSSHAARHALWLED
jgi:hypothetical protein